MEKNLKDYSFEEIIALNKEELANKKIDRVPDFIVESLKVMYPERIGKWSVFLWEVGPVEYYCAERAFEIMKAIEDGVSIPCAVQLFKSQKHKDGTHFYTSHLVALFSKQGPEFIKEVEKEMGYSTLPDEIIGKLKAENKAIEERHKKENERHSL